MSLNKRNTLIIAVIIFSSPLLVLAASHDYHEQNDKFGLPHAQHMKSEASQQVQLSTDLLSLLNQEMGLIQQGVMDLVPAMAAGKWDKVSTIGQQIKASFILKQKLTEAQKEELHQVLPQQFVEMDMDFHKSAGMLAHAAEMNNADVVNFYFYKMNAACASCHSKYAAKRFPGFAKNSEEDHHH